MGKTVKDDFFTKESCDRCGRKLDVRTMSMFNTDCICPGCKEKEKMLPEYGAAREAELAALKAGGRNFAGIGYPA